MNKTKILLTGGNGMVGRNVLEHPNAHEFAILAPSSSELNLCDFNAVQDYLYTHQPSIVIHAAGKVGGIQANIREPVAFLIDNLDMGCNLVRATHKAGIKRLINLGSSCMYPRNRNEPLTENMVLNGELEPTNEGYALAKVVTARLCEYIMREDKNYQYKTLIPCNIYGCYDKFDPERSHLIPAIIHKDFQAKQNKQATIEIWGDGTARREFMFAEDLADAIFHAVKNFDTLPTYMNIGLGYDYTINEYYQVAAEVMEYTGSFIYDLTKPVGMTRKLVNVERQHRWGWKPRHKLREGIEKTYQYYLKEQQ